jgi:hypothetical protein
MQIPRGPSRISGVDWRRGYLPLDIKRDSSGKSLQSNRRVVLPRLASRRPRHNHSHLEMAQIFDLEADVSSKIGVNSPLTIACPRMHLADLRAAPDRPPTNHEFISADATLVP